MSFYIHILLYDFLAPQSTVNESERFTAVSESIVACDTIGVQRSVPISLPLHPFARRRSAMEFPTPRIRHFLRLMVLMFLHRKAPSFCPPLEHLPHQFQKN